MFVDLLCRREKLSVMSSASAAMTAEERNPRSYPLEASSLRRAADRSSMMDNTGMTIESKDMLIMSYNVGIESNNPFCTFDDVLK